MVFLFTKDYFNLKAVLGYCAPEPLSTHHIFFSASMIPQICLAPDIFNRLQDFLNLVSQVGVAPTVFLCTGFTDRRNFAFQRQFNV